jgi:hypothetical protein
LIGRRGPFEWENLGKELPFGEPSQISLIIQEGKPDGLDGQSCLIDLADVGRIAAHFSQSYRRACSGEGSASLRVPVASALSARFIECRSLRR